MACLSGLSLTEFTDLKFKAKRKITIRDLLTHTAGIGWGFGPEKDVWLKEDIMGWYFSHRDESIQATIKRLAKLPMDAQPGEKFVYGLSIDILGALIEVVSNQPLDQFLKNEIFKLLINVSFPKSTTA
mgnify:CR=1 FL=1